MSLIICLGVGIAFLGFLTGYLVRGHDEHKDTQPASNVDLYTVMESALKTIDDGWKELNPPHDPNCPCAYCEIKYGSGQLRKVALKDPEQPYHPMYIREIHKKNDSLKREVIDLRAELERRDRRAAEEYKTLHNGHPGVRVGYPPHGVEYMTGEAN